MRKRLKLWFDLYHPHWLRLKSISTGVDREASIPVTSFLWECRFCKNEFMDITKFGWYQLCEGHSPEKVFEFWGEGRRVNND